MPFRSPTQASTPTPVQKPADPNAAQRSAEKRVNSRKNKELQGFAPAKINLFLHVIGRRKDGYHLLQSVFRLLDWGDDIFVCLADDGAIHYDSPVPGVPPGQDLVVRAAHLLREAAIQQMRSGTGPGKAPMAPHGDAHRGGVPLGCRLRLVKRLPIGGGLGGGSSDAATVLMLLNRLWRLHWPRARLAELGLRLGADVPFFLFGQDAWVEGIGEQVVPLTPQVGACFSAQHYLVLVPPVAVSTPAVFAHPDLTRDTLPLKMADFAGGLDSTSASGWPREGGPRAGLPLRNDLQTVVAREFPAVAAALDWLSQQGATARMSGSGACVYAGFDQAAAAQAVAKAAQQHDWGAFRPIAQLAATLIRHPLCVE